MDNKHERCYKLYNSTLIFLMVIQLIGNMNAWKYFECIRVVRVVFRARNTHTNMYSHKNANRTIAFNLVHSSIVIIRLMKSILMNPYTTEQVKSIILRHTLKKC